MNISHSQIARWRRCNRDWFFHYKDPDAPKPPARAHMHDGSAYHKGVAVGLQEKKDTGEEPNATFMTDTFVQYYQNPEREVDFTGVDRNKAESIGVELVKIYRADVVPYLWPEHVEQRFTVDFANRDWRMTMIPDLEADEIGMRHTIGHDRMALIDNKRSAKAPAWNEAIVNEQLTAYAMGKQAADGYLPHVVRLDFALAWKTVPKKPTADRLAAVKETKHGTVGILPLAARRTQADVDHYLDIMTATVASMEAGVYNYAAPQAWWCSFVIPGACDFGDYCRAQGPKLGG